MTSRLRTLLGCAALLLASAFGTAGVASAQSINIAGCASLSAPVVSGSNITITCNPNVVAPGSPNCSGAQLTTVGTTLTFTASCLKGTNPISLINLTAAPPGNTVALCTGAAACASMTAINAPNIPIPAVSTTYTVTASDGALTGTASAFYSATGGGGGAFDLSGCTAQGYTGRALDIAWPTTQNTIVNNGALSASPSGTFGNYDALVVRFTVPLAAATGTTKVFQPAGNAPAQGTSRVYTVSTQPCQIATSSAAAGTILNAAYGQSPAIRMTVGSCQYTGFQALIYCASTAFVAAGQTYFVTMVNRNGFPGGPNYTPSCSYANCDMRIDLDN